ncbi:MAG: manganese efflux pump [Firmicutes bacterium]|nr:manganese efflux pump [Bacillota bacterium]
MHIFLILVIAVSLSMDAFSLSLAYGTLNLERKNVIQLATIVGIYHFVMPLLGNSFGHLLLKFIPVRPELIVFLVLTIIGIQMIIESFKKETEVKQMNFFELLAFGLAVSMDSFSVGIGIQAISSHYIISSLLFSISSFIFTYLGLQLGKKLSTIFGKAATLLGGITLIAIGIVYMY